MTDFFTIPDRVREWAWRRVVGRPPSNTNDDSGTVRFNTIDWERRAKVAAEDVAGLREASNKLERVATSNHFGDLVEGLEVHARLRALVDSWRNSLQEQIDDLPSFAKGCREAGNALDDADASTTEGLREYMRYVFSSVAPKILLTIALTLILSSCLSVEGEPTPESLRPALNDRHASATNDIRQTDAQGRALPFETAFPRRWSNGNDGTTYEPCTAATTTILTDSRLDPQSARDAAAADHQTARGCVWSLSDREYADLSQYVGNQPDLDVYKQMNARFMNWSDDISLINRRVAVATARSIPECTTFVRSGEAIVVTNLSISINPPPIDEICDKAIAFTRATIDQIPE